MSQFCWEYRRKGTRWRILGTEGAEWGRSSHFLRCVTVLAPEAPEGDEWLSFAGEQGFAPKSLWFKHPCAFHRITLLPHGCSRKREKGERKNGVIFRGGQRTINRSLWGPILCVSWDKRGRDGGAAGGICVIRGPHLQLFASIICEGCSRTDTHWVRTCRASCFLKSITDDSIVGGRGSWAGRPGSESCAGIHAWCLSQPPLNWETTGRPANTTQRPPSLPSPGPPHPHAFSSSRLGTGPRACMHFHTHVFLLSLSSQSPPGWAISHPPRPRFQVTASLHHLTPLTTVATIAPSFPHLPRQQSRI